MIFMVKTYWQTGLFSTTDLGQGQSIIFTRNCIKASGQARVFLRDYENANKVFVGKSLRQNQHCALVWHFLWIFSVSLVFRIGSHSVCKSQCHFSMDRQTDGNSSDQKYRMHKSFEHRLYYKEQSLDFKCSRTVSRPWTVKSL